MIENTPNSQISKPPKWLDQLRAKCRLLHYSIRTEEAYVGWCTQFVVFHDERHPEEMGGPEIARFLTHLATERKVAASTQNQAFSALLFLYQKVLEIELPKIDCLRAQRPDRLPVVLGIDEVRAILDRMTCIHRLRVFDLEGGSSHGRSSVGFQLAHPYEFPKSKIGGDPT